jgi:long-chain acyl-CoA synthetase
MANTIPQMFLETVSAHADLPVQYSKDQNGEFRSTGYGAFLEDVRAFAAGLLELGMARGDHVGLIADNRREWLAADLAIMGLGAADVPRGCDATEQEIEYILGFSECRLALLENERQLAKILKRKAGLPLLSSIVLFDPPSAEARSAAEAAGLSLRSYAELLALGAPRLAAKPLEYDETVATGKGEELATIIYTSGTTGEPKGVCISQSNFLCQALFFPTVLFLKPGHVFLSVLPVWHAFERAVQYIILSAAAGIAYSKPVGSVMLADMQAIRPQWLTSVPRIWESVQDGVYRTLKNQSPVKKALFAFFVGIGESYSFFRDHLLGRRPQFTPRSRVLEVLWSVLPMLLVLPFRALGGLIVFKAVKSKLGGRFIAGISGGGALPPSVDRFFSAIGILILEGYGLTEASPIIGVRPQKRPVMGTVGPAMVGTKVKIVDELGEELPCGSKGLILVRGPQVMMGYYRRPELTAKVVSESGWLDTGDLGMLTRDGELRITGRAKDTIVLRGGENVEPLPIEQKLVESEYIRQAVVLGQDQRYLAALIVPDQEAVSAWAEENNVPIVDYEGLLQSPEVAELIDYELLELVSSRNGFKSFERIFRFALLAKPFEVGRELSAKQEIKRHAIVEIYHKEVKRLFD